MERLAYAITDHLLRRDVIRKRTTISMYMDTQCFLNRCVR